MKTYFFHLNVIQGLQVNQAFKFNQNCWGQPPITLGYFQTIRVSGKHFFLSYLSPKKGGKFSDAKFIKAFRKVIFEFWLFQVAFSNFGIFDDLVK